MARKPSPKKVQENLCELCYGVLSEGEVQIHDRHRNTDVGKRFLASQGKPKLKVKAAPKPRGRPRGSKTQFWLSDTEQKVVDLMIEGHKTPEIAEMLGKSSSAIATALERGKAKTNSRTLYQLVAKAVQRRFQNGGYRRERGRARDYQDRSDSSPEASKAT